jgi:rare lipoprotein A
MIQNWTRASARTAACALFAANFATGATDAAAKTPGKTYCFHGHCHTVKTIAETQALVGKTQILKASFYDDPGSDRFNPSNITSSGAYFRSDKADNAASPILPDGTKAVVWNPRTKKAAMIRINNAGPYWGDRKLDLSRAAAEKIGITTGGVGTVHMRVVEAPTKAEAGYQRGRTYAPVKGFLGAFADLDAAIVSIGRSIFGQPAAVAKAAPAKSAVTADASPVKTVKPGQTVKSSKTVDDKPVAAKTVEVKPATATKPIVTAKAKTETTPKPALKTVVAAAQVKQPPAAATSVAKVSLEAAKVPVSAMEVRVKNAQRDAEREAALPRSALKAQRGA